MDHQQVQQFNKTVLKVRQGFLWFLRFFSIFMFGTVLLMGLMWKLPWKITAAFALIPALGIFVPRKLLAVVFLIPILLTVGIYVWVQLPGTNSGQWQVYQFQPEPSEWEDLQPLDPSQNAAVLYEKMLQGYGESIFGYQFMDTQSRSDTFNQAWTLQDYPKLAQWLKTFQDGIDLFLQAAQMPQCQFNIPRNLNDTQQQQQRINQLKGWSRLILRSANLDLGQNRLEQAMEKQLAVVALAGHLYQQQTLFDQAGAFHIELLASRALETTIVNHCDSPQDLAAIRTAAAGLDSGWAKNWRTIVEREKLLAKNIAGLFYEVRSDGQTRISHRAMYALQEGLGYQPRRLFLKQHEMSRLAVIGMWLSLPTKPERVAKIIDKRFEYYSLETQKGQSLEIIPVQKIWQMGLNCRSAVNWLAMQQIKYFWALDGQDRRHDALVNVITLFTLVKQYQLEHGRWPQQLDLLDVENLNDLITDPVYGKSFIYRRTDQGFQLYSLGPNHLDDLGINNPENDKDDIIFWPRGTMDETIEDSDALAL